MALVDDVVTSLLLVAAGFFVALAFGLLVRYRQVSQKITTSSDLGHDLWNALEQRMRKQDERILDMMGRLEVVQSRVVATAAAREPPTTPPPTPSPATAGEEPRRVTEPERRLQQPESQITSLESRVSQPAQTGFQLDETQLGAIRFLAESPKNTRQITDALKKSREHTARVMKELFEMGFVRRNDSTKPFVYQLTDVGRRFLLAP
jgi:DNA-binding MarR family transcriptional regulator